MTAVSIALGIVLAVLFGAANAYLGLRVGMTVSRIHPGCGYIHGCDPRDTEARFHP